MLENIQENDDSVFQCCPCWVLHEKETRYKHNNDCIRSRVVEKSLAPASARSFLLISRCGVSELRQSACCRAHDKWRRRYSLAVNFPAGGTSHCFITAGRFENTSRDKLHAVISGKMFSRAKRHRRCSGTLRMEKRRRRKQKSKVNVTSRQDNRLHRLLLRD